MQRGTDAYAGEYGVVEVLAVTGGVSGTLKTRLMLKYINTVSSYMFFELICQINEQKGFCSEYLLLNAQGERMHNDAINNALRRINKKIEISQKGNHSIRKTCISNLAASKLLSDEEIRMFAGHKDISTTQQSYIFATEPLEDRVSAYEAAISGKMPDVNVFKGVQIV